MSSLYRTALIFLLCLAMLSESRGQCDITVDAGEDIYLCAPPTPTQLNGNISGEYLSFMWTPTTGLTGANTLQPTANVTQSTNYVLKATAADLSNNLVSNGDFESGNTDFTSDYGYSPGDLVPEGLYDVLDNPMDDHPGFAACEDHTSGTGNMMVVNGAGTPNQNVWCQTVPVTPNAQYVLSAWVTSVVAGSPALLQFSINGTPLGPIFSAPGSVCNWQNYFQTWDSGSNSSATICIVNQNTALGGNDFALDDIVFAPTCTETDTVHIEVVNITAFAAPSVVTLPCDGAAVTISGIGSSSGANITYLWDTFNGNIVSGETTLTPTINASGEYILTVTYTAPDGTICEKMATVNAILTTNPLTAWINPAAPLGCGSSTTTLVGNSTQPGFSIYSWETFDGNIVSGDNLKNCVVNQIGTYYLTVTNTNTGCTATAETLVDATTTPPTAMATVSDTLSCFQDTVLLSAAGSSSGNNISYTWTTIGGHFISGINSDTALVDSIGVYILNVTNTSSNCTSRDTIIVIGNLALPPIFVPQQQQITCTSDTLTMVISLNQPPFVLINWVASNGGHIVSGQFTPNPQVDSAGNYYVSVQDPINGCISYDSTDVVANMNSPLAEVSTPGLLTCATPNISISGDSSSTGPQFGYTWLASNGGNIVSGDTSLNPTVNAAGDYILTVLDSLNGCISMDTASVSADTNIVVVIANAPDTLNCSTQTVLLNATGSSNGPAFIYAWTSSDGNIVSGADTPNPLVDQPGTYQLLVTNSANGCTGTDSATAIENIASPQISISPPAQLTCAVSSISLAGQNNNSGGNFSYSWVASNGGNIVSGQNTLTPTIDAPGTYTLTSTNLVNGCSDTASTVVTLAAGVPIAASSVAGPLTCTQVTQIVDGAGSSIGATYSYNWTAINGGNIVGSNTNISATVDAAGSYILAVSNSANGCVIFDTVVVNQNITAPPAEAGPTDTLTCATPISMLQANAPTAPGSLLFSWSTPNGMFASNTDSALVSVTAPGNYFVTVTDPTNGCIAIDSVQILEDKQVPTLDLTIPEILTCTLLNQSLLAQNLSLPGNFSYDWLASNGGNILSGNTNINPIIDAPGTYILTTTNLTNGCSSTLSASVTQDTVAPNLQIVPPGPITCANLSQVIQGQNLSIPGNFSYAWSAANGGNIVSGNATLTPTVDASGDYIFVSINLDNGCTSSSSVNVLQDQNLPLANAGLDDTLTCNLNTLTITGTGAGAPILDFNWVASNGGNISSGANSETPIIDAPGSYTLTVLNPDNGCSATDVVEIFNDASAPIANAGNAPILSCALTQTALNATASTGANFTYNWIAGPGANILNGDTSLMPNINAPGLYTLVVTNNANGCTSSSGITVLEDITPPNIDAGPDVTLTCFNSSLSLSGINNSGPATFTWQTTDGNIVTGGNSLNPNINQTGTYTLTATLTTNGCSATDIVSVGIDTISPVFSIQQAMLLTCTQLSTPINSSVQQPSAGNYFVNWNTPNGHFVSGQNTLNPIVDAPGTYILNVENSLNGCDAALAVLVFQDTIAPTAIAAPASDITCNIPSLNLDGAGSSAGSGFSYSWSSDPSGQILSGATTLTPSVGSAGTYTLQVTNSSTGCTASASTTVGSNTTAPNVVIAPPGLLTCTQTNLILNAAGSSAGPNFTPSWATSAGNIVSGQGSLMVLVDQPGNYVLSITNSQNGCTASTQVLVDQNVTNPGAEAGTAAELHCNQLQVSLTGSAPGSATMMSYAWTSTDGHIVSGASVQVSAVDTPGLYTLTVTDPLNGCTAMDNVSVSAVLPPAFSPTLIQPDCHAQNGMVDFGSVLGGRAPFEYSTDGGQTFENQSLASNLPPDTYALVVQDAFGCTAEETITIDQPFLPTLSIPAIATLEVGDSILLQPLTNIPAGNVASWEWTPSDGLSCSDCENPWAMPFRSITYTLVVTDQNGCEAETQVQVLVNRKRKIYAPNVFSPNGDGINDFFMLFGKGVKEIQSLQIFDRWGSQLFLGKQLQAGDEQAGWDGRYRGSALSPAVFVWWAKVEFVDGTVELYYGDVTLVR